MKRIDLALQKLQPVPATSAGRQTSARALMHGQMVHEERKLQSAEVERRHWFPKEAEGKPPASERCHVGTKTPVLGSEDCKIHTDNDVGFFDTVLAAYNNHWILRTCPEDWWYCIVQKVARAVDDHSKSEKVRKFFVNHEGKKTLSVTVGPSIYGVDYSWFFDQMTDKINDNIKVPKYVDTMTADFTSTSAAQRIISQIGIMTSVQEFFEFSMVCGCGIPAVEMAGQEEDWLKLVEKFQQLRKLLEPISEDLKLTKWWGTAKGVLLKLVDTYNGKPDKLWWGKIIDRKGYNMSGMGVTWTGWFITDFLGELHLYKIKDFKSGLVSVPMKVVDAFTGHKEDSALIAGMAGYKVFNDGNVPVVEANHGWAMLLEPNSAFRRDMETWEKKISLGG